MRRQLAVCVLLAACAPSSAPADGGSASPDAFRATIDTGLDAPAAAIDMGLDAIATPDGGTDTIFPLHVSSDTHHLVDASGRAFLVQGDSPWELIQNLDETDTLAYLDDRHARGLNAILVELVEHHFTPHTPPSANVAGDVPFASTSDFTTTQEAYFAHVDWVLARACERGILVFLVPAYVGYACGDEGWCAEMRTNGVDRLRAYGVFVGTRYRDVPNIVWVEGGDETPSGADLALVDAVAEGLVMGDGGAHLHTAHWARGTRSSSVAGITFPLGLDASYTGGPPSYPQLVTDAASAHGVRPMFVIENRYEGENGTTPRDLRAQMYQPILAGAAGFFFGSDPLWYLGSSGDGNPGWTFGDGMYVDWRAALDGGGSRDDARAGAFFRSIAWETLRPDTTHALMTGGFGTAGSDDYVLCAVNDAGTLAVAYLPSHLSPTFDLTRMHGAVTATWIDPTGTARMDAGAGLTFTPPATNAAGGADWVLLLTSS